MKSMNAGCHRLLLILLLANSDDVLAFQQVKSPIALRALSTSSLFLASEAPRSRKRRKRKEAIVPDATALVDDDTTTIAITTDEPLVPRDRTGVALPIQNAMSSSETPKSKKQPTRMIGDASVQDLLSNFDAERKDDDPLAMMLTDAQAMGSPKDGEQGGGAMAKAKNVLSTIVTVDFFVVCALLVWFLTGIASSTLFQDDRIQIAFNGIFEPVVQPALGVLMIASLSGAVLPEESDQNTDIRN